MTLLVAWFWQGVLVAAGVGLLLRVLPRLNAATRHVVWWGALAAVVVLGVVYLGGVGPASPAAAARSAGPASPTTPLVSLPAAPGWLLTVVLAAWAAAALHGVVRVLRGGCHVARLRRQAVPLDGVRTARFARWTAGRWVRRAQVCVTGAPVGACAIGFRRPAIVVSRRLLDTLDDERLDQVVLHEQAHLDRHDDWLRLLQSLLTAAVAIHPAAWFIGRRIDLEREAACDDRVVSATGAAGDYAACLTEAAGAIARRAPVAAVSVLGGASASGGTLRARIVRLLDPRPDRSRRVVRPVVAAAVASIGALLVAAPLMSSLVVFVERAAPPADVVTASAQDVAAVPPARVAPGRDLPARQPPPAAESSTVRAPVVRAETGVKAVGIGAAHEAPPEVAAAPAQEPSAPPPVADLLVAGLHDIPNEALGASTLLVADVPPLQPATSPGAAAPRPVTPETSLLGGVSSFGRVSAITVWKAGLSVAGTLARAGKAMGKLY
jgi:beta-lactamase regulating signal transducer with metallopeptidase domain